MRTITDNDSTGNTSRPAHRADYTLTAGMAVDPTPENVRHALNLSGWLMAAALNTRLDAGDKRAPMVELARLTKDIEDHDGTAYVPAFDLLRHAAGAVDFWCKVPEAEL